MYTVKPTTRFQKDLKLAAKRGYQIDLLTTAIKTLVAGEPLVDGETWADSTTFETMEDAKNFAEACEPNVFAEKFYSFLNFNSCKSNFFSIEKDCQRIN